VPREFKRLAGPAHRCSARVEVRDPASRHAEAGVRPPGGRARRSDTITHREETLDNKRQARAATSRISQRMILSKNRLARSRPHLEWRDPRVPLQPRRGESLCTDSLAFDLKSNFARAFERIL
jgi:hypothetical protein